MLAPRLLHSALCLTFEPTVLYIPQRITKESYLFGREKSAASPWNQVIKK